MPSDHGRMPVACCGALLAPRDLGARAERISTKTNGGSMLKNHSERAHLKVFAILGTLGD
eukprot:4160610-Alexandrium_andersonii.AAC.1